LMPSRTSHKPCRTALAACAGGENTGATASDEDIESFIGVYLRVRACREESSSAEYTLPPSFVKVMRRSKSRVSVLVLLPHFIEHLLPQLYHRYVM
jgi:hypothetical protein